MAGGDLCRGSVAQVGSSPQTRQTVPVKIGILTSGGDCPGLNAVIRGIVLKGDKVYEHTFLGIRDGYRGLVEDDIFTLPR